jgi:hypothetical protein
MLAAPGRDALLELCWTVQTDVAKTGKRWRVRGRGRGRGNGVTSRIIEAIDDLMHAEDKRLGPAY